MTRKRAVGLGLAATLAVALAASSCAPGGHRAATHRPRAHRSEAAAPESTTPTSTTVAPATTTTTLAPAVAAPPPPSTSAPVARAPRPATKPTSVPLAYQPRPEPNRSAPAATTQTPSPGAVWPGDFPDPYVLLAGGFYYAYSTQVGLSAVPVIRSVDLVHWQSVGDALQSPARWSNGLAVWAPAVVKSATGYVMFYTTRDARTGDQCISRAVSALPQGPYVDTSVGPFMCQLDQGGDIDPSPFVDANGSQWLVWKSQGTRGGQPPRIWTQPVTNDWTILGGTARAILTVSQRWEGSVVEAPDMVQLGRTLFLLYSGNDWNSSRYAVGFATCASMVGPCAKPVNGPVFASHGSEAGPGSGTVFTDVWGHLRFAFHSWTTGKVGYPGGTRSLHLGSVGVSGGRISIQG